MNATENKKTILIVNTGPIKKRFFFQKLKKLGITVVALHKEKNWASMYVDHWILADTNNYKESVEAVKQFLSDNPKVKIDGAATFWEESVLLTSKITDAFNLIGIPYSISKKVRNKALFREFCKKHSIQSPNFLIIRKKDDIAHIEKKLQFPVVIKPIYGSGSAFVIKVDSKEELVDTFGFIKKNITNHPDAAEWDDLEVYVEEYIDGDEVDIDMILQNGKVKFYSVADNYQVEEPFFLETGQAIPSSLSEISQAELLSLAEEVLEKLGIQNGIIHFEAKYTREGPVPIEVNLRMGGDYVYSYIKDAWGVDMIEYAVKIALGEYIKIQKPPLPKKYIIGKDFLSEYSGVLVKMQIDEKLHAEKCVEEIHFYKQTGEPVFAPPEGYDFVGWVTVSGDSIIDAQDNLNRIMKYVNYEIVKFDPASSIGKTQRKNRFSNALFDSKTLVRGVKIASIKRVTKQQLRKLHIGIACNMYEGNGNEVEQDLTKIGKNIEKVLSDRGYKITFFDFNNLNKAFNQLRTSSIDIVFNVCERINDSSLLEPHGASILDALQIPYTGSNPFTLALCIDKIRVKKLLSFHNIPTPKWDYAYEMDDDIRDDLQYPLIVKPGNTDNSIGITNDSIVTDKKSLYTQLEKVIKGLNRPALIEEFIEGDEYDVSILGSEYDDLRVLPLSRSLFNEMPKGYWHIYPFDAKWTEGSAYDKIRVQRPPKNISRRLQSLISEIALDTYNILDCHDYGRVEIRVDRDGNPYVLELNPNPSIDIEDCVPACAECVGMDYGDFIEEIISLAIKRYKNRPPYYHLQANLI